jgi:hypothetical protein
MQVTFIFYLLISMSVILGSVFLNLQSGSTVSAGILGIGFLIISIIFGIQTFTPSGDIKSEMTPGPWPPTINVCPDYLSLMTVNGEPKCIDPIGVSTNANALRKWTGPGGDTFDLRTALTAKNRIDQLCDDCRAKGLTWEGVWDGSACLGNNPPIPVSRTNITQ